MSRPQKFLFAILSMSVGLSCGEPTPAASETGTEGVDSGAADSAGATSMGTGDGDSTMGDGDGDGTSGDGTSTGDGDGTTTGDGDGTTTGDGDGTTTGDGDGDGTTTGGFVPGDGDGDGTTTGAPPGPNGASCSVDAECASSICVDIAGFAGLCSECRADADCVNAGTGLNCYMGGGGFFECGAGGVGQSCMSDDGCSGVLVCAQVIDLGGLSNDMFCSECADDAGCPAGELCTPSFVFGANEGQRECLPPGGSPHSGLCDVGSDAQCATGLCESVSVMGFINLGVCGDCDTSNPCATGSCVPGSVDVAGGSGLIGSVCV